MYKYIHSWSHPEDRDLTVRLDHKKQQVIFYLHQGREKPWIWEHSYTAFLTLKETLYGTRLPESLLQEIKNTVRGLLHADPIEDSLPDEADTLDIDTLRQLRQMLYDDDVSTVRQAIQRTENLCQSEPQWAFELIRDICYSVPNIFVLEQPEWLRLCLHRHSILLWILGLQARLGRASDLKKFSLRNQPLAFIHENIQYLAQLETIDLSYSRKEKLQPRELPDAIGKLPNLKKLLLKLHHPTVLPSNLSALQNLEVFVIGHAPITALPSDIGALTRLLHLSIFETQVSTLPQSLSSLSLLEALSLSNNQLTHIPDAVLDLPALKRIFFPGNPLKSISTRMQQFVGTEWMEKYYPDLLD